MKKKKKPFVLVSRTAHENGAEYADRAALAIVELGGWGAGKVDDDGKAIRFPNAYVNLNKED